MSKKESVFEDDELRRPYPRGHFTQIDKWTEDKSNRYFKGFN